jgi:hypothetical protein
VATLRRIRVTGSPRPSLSAADVRSDFATSGSRFPFAGYEECTAAGGR